MNSNSEIENDAPSEEEQETVNDIKIIKENLKGDDCIIGDVHGNLELLKSTVKELGKYDRLIIVGDLVDRGKDSAGVITYINQINKKSPGKIEVIRGNHEDMCLDAIAGLETLLTKPETQSIAGNILANLLSAKKLESSYLNYGGVREIFLHAKNGGKWLPELFASELNNKISIGTVNDGDGDTDVIQYYDKYKNDRYIGSKVYMIKNYMSDLPYIIFTEGKRKFGVVHADMHANPENLYNTARNGNTKIDKNNKNYIVWARESEDGIKIMQNDRNEDSMLVFVGHTMIDNGEPAVRKSTNTINLDVGAYHNDIILLVNHTKGTCKFIAKNKDVDIDKILKELPALVTAKNDIEKHLQLQMQKDLKMQNAKDHLKKLENFYKKNKNNDTDTIKNNYLKLQQDSTNIIGDLKLLSENNGNKVEQEMNAKFSKIEKFIAKHERKQRENTPKRPRAATIYNKSHTPLLFQPKVQTEANSSSKENEIKTSHSLNKSGNK